MTVLPRKRESEATHGPRETLGSRPRARTAEGERLRYEAPVP